MAADNYPQTDGNKISIVAWVYADSRPMWASIAKNWGHPSVGQFHFGLCEASGALEAHIVDRQGELIAAIASEPLPLNEWQHVAMVADGENLRIYRNGEQVAATPCEGLSRPNPPISKLAIGSKLNDEQNESAGVSSRWNGRLDEIAVFNYALSSSQISRLYGLSDQE